MFYLLAFPTALYLSRYISPSAADGGIIDRVSQDVFMLLGEKRKCMDGLEAKVRVSYMELYREELRDLLELHSVQKELHIREDERGNTSNEKHF